MKAWLGSLSDYNAGRLIGAWFDITPDADENAAAIRAALALSRDPCAEEWFAADYDETPDALAQLLGENPPPETLAAAAALLQAVGERFDDDEAAAVLGEMLDGELAGNLPALAESADTWISDHYAGRGDSLVDWCAGFLEECGTLEPIPEDLRGYFDVASYARDMEAGGGISTARIAGGDVLVFWKH